jgi:hypothetical protein
MTILPGREMSVIDWDIESVGGWRSGNRRLFHLQKLLHLAGVPISFVAVAMSQEEPSSIPIDSDFRRATCLQEQYALTDLLTFLAPE